MTGGTTGLLATICLVALITGSSAQSVSFTEGVYTLSVPETRLDSYPEEETVYPDAGSPRPSGNIGHVGCVDSSTGGPVDVSYSIIEAASGAIDSDPGPFVIGMEDGNISVTADLDYEVKTFYTFTVRCRDNTETSLTDTATVLVDIEPINEFVPRVDRTSFTVFESESSVPGTVLVSVSPDDSGSETYLVTDTDEGGSETLQYSLSIDPEQVTPNTEHFSVDPITGALSVTGSLDVDTTSGSDSVTVTMSVCDIDPPSELCPNVRLRILISASNDNFPKLGQDMYEKTVPEDLLVNSTVDLGIVCTDNDTGAGSLQGVELSNQNLSMWEVNSAGVFTLRESLDFEDSQRHEFMIKCLDTGGREDEATVVITVSPVNDNPLFFKQVLIQLQVNRIEIPDKTLGSVQAFDDDVGGNNAITYSIINENNNFEINENTGEIVMVDYIWAFEGNSFTLNVLASESNGDNATITVEVEVTGLLSVPEYILVGVGAFLFLLIAAAVFICVCTYHCIKWRKKPLLPRDSSQQELNEYVDMPTHMPMMGHPIMMVSQPPAMMNPYYPYPDDYSSQGDDTPSLTATDEPDFADTLESTVPSESRLYHMGPILQEMVDIFHDGDKLLVKNSKK